DVHIAALEAYQSFSHGFLGLKTTEYANTDRVLGQSLAKSQKVLLGEHGSWAQKCHLAAFHDVAEGGSEGHLGFAEANVAAHQPVHHDVPFQVGKHVFDCSGLVWCLFKGELRFEGAILIARWRQGWPRGARALSIQPQELVSHVAHTPPHSGFGAG